LSNRWAIFSRNNAGGSNKDQKAFIHSATHNADDKLSARDFPREKTLATRQSRFSSVNLPLAFTTAGRQWLGTPRCLPVGGRR